MNKGVGGGWSLKKGLLFLSQSELLFECSASSIRGGVGSRCLDCFVGHDTGGEFLLGLLKACTSGPIQPVDLHTHTKASHYITLHTGTDVTSIVYK